MKKSKCSSLLYTGRSWKQVLNPLARSSFQKKTSKSIFALRSPLICLLLRTLMSRVWELPRVFCQQSDKAAWTAEGGCLWSSFVWVNEGCFFFFWWILEIFKIEIRYIFFKQGRELSWQMKDGWTGQESQWGGQMGDLCLEIQQIQMGKRWQLKSALRKWLKNSLCSWWQPSLHRLQRKHDKFDKIWKVVCGKIVENSFQTNNHRQHQWNFFACIFHLKRLHYKNNILCFKCIYSKSDESCDQSFALRSRFWSTGLSSLHVWGGHVLPDDIWSKVFCNWLSEADFENVRGRENIWEAGQTNSSVTNHGAGHVI